MPFYMRKYWPTLLSALLFAGSGWLGPHWWVADNGATFHLEAQVGLIFGIPLVLLCRCRDPRLRILWLAASFLVWEFVWFTGRFLLVIFGHATFAVAGALGALMLTGCFLSLARWVRFYEVLLALLLGLLGGVVFGETLGDGPSLGSNAGFATWQILVGSYLVWMSGIEDPDDPRNASAGLK